MCLQDLTVRKYLVIKLQIIIVLLVRENDLSITVHSES